MVKSITDKTSAKHGITKKNKSLFNSDIMALVFLTVSYAVFNLLLVNKFFPVTEGWFQDAANYINSGQTLYSDFYMFIPPGFPMLTSLISSLCDNAFIVFRLLGVGERLLMVMLVYRIIRRICSPAVSAVACLTGATIYIANLQEIFYGYYQTSLFIGLICVWLCIRMYETFEQSPYAYAFAFGAGAALSFMFKQTLGLLLSFAMGTMFLAAVYFVNIKKALKTLSFVALGCLSFFTVAFISMYAAGNLKPFIEQVFGGASSKGSLLSVLFGFWPRILTVKALIICCLFLAFFLFTVLKKKKKGKTAEKVCSIGQWVSLSILSLSFVFIFFKAVISRDKAFPLSVNYALSLLLGVIILSVGTFFMCRKKKSALYAKVSLAVLLTGFVFLFIIISENKESVMDLLMIRDFRQHLLYAVFGCELIISVYLLYKVAIKKNRDLPFF